MIKAPKSDIASIQYLRAVAAVAVVHFHIFAMGADIWPDGSVAKSPFGAAGVDLFFVISGFLMALTVSRSASKSPALFMLKRIRRVAPLYFLVTLFVFALMMVKPSLFGSGAASWSDLLSSLLFVPILHDGAIKAPVLLVGWTLNYEMFFYVLIAVLIALANDTRLWLTSATLVGLAVAGLIYRDLHPLVGYYANPIVLEFALGIACFQLWSSGWLGRMAPLAGVMMVAAGFAAVAFGTADDASPWRCLAWGIPASMVLCGALAMPQFASRALHAVGDWSYSLYLTHLFVVAAMLKILAPMAAANGLPFILVYAAIMIVAIFVSGLVYRFAEEPVIALAKGERLSVRLFLRGSKPHIAAAE